MSYKSRTLTVLVSAALALSACGSADPDETSETTAGPAQASSEGGLATDAGGLTAATVEVDGVTYMVSCVAVSPTNLSDPLGQTDYLGNTVSASTLAGVSTDNAIAVEVDGGACTAGDQQLSDWSLATAQDLDTGQAQQIACDSGLKVSGC